MTSPYDIATPAEKVAMQAARVWHFLGLVFRPHPYAYPCDRWEAWTKYLVGPAEAWMIAGVTSGVTWGRR